MAGTEALYDWLRACAWPLWLRHGVDWRAGAFHDSLTLDGYHATETFRRLRVLARQIYVFSQAHHHGVERADEAVRIGLDYLFHHALQDDGGYAWRFALDGTVIDDRRDLYDHAFVLLALSAAASMGASDSMRAQALALDHFINTQLLHSQVGYLEQMPPLLPRRQNPHMHLLEAYLAAATQFQETLFLARAEALIKLFVGHLFCSKEDLLPEYFNDNLEPLRVDGRFAWEPGHHCEWIWLLDWYERLSGTDVLAPLREALWQRVVTAGINQQDGGVINEVWSDGKPKDTDQRLWPQTERLKAAWLMRTSMPLALAPGVEVLQGFLREDGLWQERRGADPLIKNTVAPASSLYHLTSGILFIRSG